MSISNLVGNIVERVVRIPRNWKNKHDVVHAMVASAMCQEDEALDDVIAAADSWATACGSNFWEEKCPKLTLAKVTCLACLARE